MPGTMGAGESARQILCCASDDVNGWTAIALDLLSQRTTVHELRDDVQIPVDLLERVNGADARVLQRGGRLALHVGDVRGTPDRGPVLVRVP